MIERKYTAGTYSRVYSKGYTSGSAPKTQSGLFTHEQGPFSQPGFPLNSHTKQQQQTGILSIDLKDRLKKPQAVAYD